MRLDKNLTAIITGGASGLGEATVRLLASKGVKVVIADLNIEQGEKIAAQLNISFFKTDITDESNVKKLFEYTIQKYKNIHVVVNCAGIPSAGNIIYSQGVLSSEIVQSVLNINVIGTFNVSKYAAFFMSKQSFISEGERGLIINVSSVAGFEGQKGQVAYSASKGAVLGMTLPMARDLGKFGIRVMTIAPGVFQTPMSVLIRQKPLQHLIKNTPLARQGKAIQFGYMVISMIQNPFATGAIWRIDGGIRMPYL